MLICVLSLMQIEHARAGSDMTVDNITSALNNARLLQLRTGSGTIIVNCEEYDDICTGTPSWNKDSSAIERYFRGREENPDSTGLVMKTIGLSPFGPLQLCGQKQTGTELSLKIAQSNNSILSDAIAAS